MKSWDAFLPDVAPELPGAPDILMTHELRNAAIDFCERTRIHVVTLDAEDAGAGVGECLVIPPTAATSIVEVMSVSFNGQELEPKTLQEIRDGYGADWRALTGTPACYTQQSMDTVALVPAPASAITAAIVIDVALCPSPSATGIDEWLFSKFRMAIAAGAKARMMAMANVPWGAADRVDFYRSRFEGAIIEATSVARKSLVRAMPRFGGGFC